MQPGIVQEGNQFYYMYEGQKIGPYPSSSEGLNALIEHAQQDYQQHPGKKSTDQNIQHLFDQFDHDAQGGRMWDMINGQHDNADLGGDNGLLDKFRQKLGGAIDHPGLTPEQEQQMVNQSQESLTQGENDAQMRASEMAGAMGFGESGDKMHNSREISSEYDAKRNAAERDTRLGVAKQRGEQGLQALGLGGGYLGAAQNRAADEARWRASANLGLLESGYVPGGNGTGETGATGGGMPAGGNPQGGAPGVGQGVNPMAQNGGRQVAEPNTFFANGHHRGMNGAPVPLRGMNGGPAVGQQGNPKFKQPRMPAKMPNRVGYF